MLLPVCLSTRNCRQGVLSILDDSDARAIQAFMNTDERIKVVVVDDHRDTADNLAELLVLEGFNAKAVYGGGDAIRLVAAFKPECILFDIAMPGIDGLQLAAHLRDAHGDDLVLLAMTGNAEDARVADTFAVVDHYFAKPFEISALLKVLRPTR